MSSCEKMHCAVENSFSIYFNSSSIMFHIFIIEHGNKFVDRNKDKNYQLKFLRFSRFSMGKKQMTTNQPIIYYYTYFHVMWPGLQKGTIVNTINFHSWRHYLQVCIDILAVLCGGHHHSIVIIKAKRLWGGGGGDKVDGDPTELMHSMHWRWDTDASCRN